MNAKRRREFFVEQGERIRRQVSGPSLAGDRQQARAKAGPSVRLRERGLVFQGPCIGKTPGEAGEMVFYSDFGELPAASLVLYWLGVRA